ncbi:MAG: hypothetical protein ACR2PZ_21975 [Pseudomonadales bacterium]
MSHTPSLIGFAFPYCAKAQLTVPQNHLSRRAKQHLPTVLLTLLSIVQALALELMWSHLKEQELLYHWSFVSFLSWIQILATLLGVLLIWLIYSTLVMRFRWVPSTGDSIFPFLIGIIEFALIGSLGPDRFGQWFLLLGLVFGAMAWVSHVTMRRARLDGDNDVYFASMERATLRDHYPTIAVVFGLELIGMYLWASGNQGIPALIALLIAISVLGVQLWLSDYYWKLSLAASGETAAADSEQRLD